MTVFYRNALAQRKKDKGNCSMTTSRGIEKSGAFIINYTLAEMAEEKQSIWVCLNAVLKREVKSMNKKMA